LSRHGRASTSRLSCPASCGASSNHALTG
jgi:hypothetical protein